MSRPGRLDAPFTPDQVSAINAFQADGRLHPFTCGGDRSDAAHAADARERGLADAGILVATRDGLACPACGYRQTWVHAGMASARP